MQERARAHLKELYGQLHSWRAVSAATGVNKGQCWKISKHKARASRAVLAKLHLEVVRKPRIPWKKKYQLLRKYMKERMASGRR